jgi:hypothetical protein
MVFLRHVKRSENSDKKGDTDITVDIEESDTQF